MGQIYTRLRKTCQNVLNRLVFCCMVVCYLKQSVASVLGYQRIVSLVSEVSLFKKRRSTKAFQTWKFIAFGVTSFWTEASSSAKIRKQNLHLNKRTTVDFYKVQVFENVKWLKPILDAKTNHLVLAVWLLFGAFPTLLFYVTSSIDGSFSFSGLSLKDDYIFLSYYIYIPAFISLAVIYLPKYSEVIRSLSQVITFSNDTATKENVNSKSITSEKMSNILTRVSNMLNAEGKAKLIQTSLIIGGILWAFMCADAHWHSVETYGVEIWSSSSFLTSFITRTVYELVIFGYILPVLLYKYFALLVSIRFLFVKLSSENAITLRPMSPDDAGGLGSFGSYSLKLVLVFLPFLLPILAYIVSGFNTLPFLLGVSLYTPAVLFIFFFPLSGAHGLMKEEKDTELKVILEMFNTAYDNMRNSYSSGGQKLAEYLSEVQSLGDIYHKTSKMPVWPFTLKTLRGFLAVVGATFLSIWLDWAVSKIF